MVDLPEKLTRNVRPGAKDNNPDDIATVKAALMALGYPTGSEDVGYSSFSTLYNNETYGSVKEFQEAHGLKSDGVVGPKTLAALRGALEEKKASDLVKADAQVEGDTILRINKDNPDKVDLRIIAKDLGVDKNRLEAFRSSVQEVLETSTGETGIKFFRDDYGITGPEFQKAQNTPNPLFTVQEADKGGR